MKKEDLELEKYKLLSTVVLHESKAMWETSQLFLFSNTILATILGADIFGRIQHASKIIFWLLPLLGLLISVLWFFSYNRTSRYYKFRMAQARNIEPKDFHIFEGIPNDIANGEIVHVNGKHYSVRVLGCNFRSLVIVNLIIISFIIFYLLIILSLYLNW